MPKEKPKIVARHFCLRLEETLVQRIDAMIKYPKSRNAMIAQLLGEALSMAEARQRIKDNSTKVYRTLADMEKRKMQVREDNGRCGKHD